MDKQLLGKAVPKESTQKGGSSREPWVPLLIEPFDGIRKNNARKIFGILLIIDFAMELIM